MAVQVYQNIYKQEIPLPKNPLKALNNYVIVSEDRNLIIDTGFNMTECKEAFMQGIKEMGLDLSKTDLFITHLHADHSGLAGILYNEGVKIYAGKVDGRMINEMTDMQYWFNLQEDITMFDLERDNVSYKDHPAYKYCAKEPFEFTPLEQGDIMNIGEYCFEVIDIPGHTPGQIGLYEKNHKIFFCGDHILDKITPNIAFWGFEWDILSVYFESLKKIYEYDIDYLFTAHRGFVLDHKKRINELNYHHEKRLEEVMRIIKDSKKSVRDTAAEMHWDLRYDKWEEFPNAQKWFASGEAMAHLEHLVCTGRAEKTNEDGKVYYKLNNS